MNSEKAKILLLVEGARTDTALMERLLSIYGISQRHKIVSYNTNLYTLYNCMFEDGDPSAIDLLQHLKEHERDTNKKAIFDERYSDIILIFDLDPHDPKFSFEKIKRMTEYFTESSDMGKLYINYPMVEAFYHMKSIPDPDYENYIVTLQELKDKQYKMRVNKENRDRDYSKFAVNKRECDIVIKQNILKAKSLCKDRGSDSVFNLNEVLDKQLDLLQRENILAVLCTCAFYIVDYNSNLIN